MPLQNRVTPFGEIIAAPARGLLMGNRGILHDGSGRLGHKRWKHNHWVSCVTKRGNRRVPLMEPGHYTPLFFLDEAVALAAGHRPCARCRYEASRRFAEAWLGNARLSTKEMDRILHDGRVDPVSRGQRTHTAAFDDLPRGTFVGQDGEAWLVLDSSLARYTPSGYDECVRKPSGSAVVLTPAAAVAALAGGYSPVIHPSAGVVAE